MNPARSKSCNCYLFIQHEVLARLGLNRIADSLDAPRQPVEYSLYVTALLHRDDPQLIFFVDPGQEGFIFVVVNAATLRLVPLHPRHLQVWVARHEEEMIINQLLANLIVHPSEREVGAG